MLLLGNMKNLRDKQKTSTLFAYINLKVKFVSHKWFAQDQINSKQDLVHLTYILNSKLKAVYTLHNEI